VNSIKSSCLLLTHWLLLAVPLAHLHCSGARTRANPSPEHMHRKLHSAARHYTTQQVRAARPQRAAPAHVRRLGNRDVCAVAAAGVATC
jgi:hypothetical protein